MFETCPKCGHAPLPADQSLPAACPACGVILAKVGQTATARQRRARADDLPRQVSADSRLGQLLIPKPISRTHLLAHGLLLAALAVWSIRLIGMDYRSGEFGQSFIHLPLLIFHEAGHVIFRPLGQWMMVLGGTVGQLLMPAIITTAFLRQNQDPLGASVGLWLLGVSILDVAPYQYDALEPKLMLLSGSTGEEGGHDWIYLFTSTGLLTRAHWLGGLTHLAGALVVLLSLAWASYLLWSAWRSKAKSEGHHIMRE